MQPNIMGELLVHESEYLVFLAISVVNLHDFVEICSPVRVNVSQYHPGHVFLPWCALSTHSAYDLGQQVGFGYFAFRRTRSLVNETFDEARNHLVVSQQSADVYVIVRGHVVARWRGEIHRVLLLRRYNFAIGAADSCGLMDEHGCSDSDS